MTNNVVPTGVFVYDAFSNGGFHQRSMVTTIGHEKSGMGAFLFKMAKHIAKNKKVAFIHHSPRPKCSFSNLDFYLMSDEKINQEETWSKLTSHYDLVIDNYGMLANLPRKEYSGSLAEKAKRVLHTLAIENNCIIMSAVKISSEKQKCRVNEILPRWWYVSDSVIFKFSMTIHNEIRCGIEKNRWGTSEFEVFIPVEGIL